MTVQRAADASIAERIRGWLAAKLAADGVAISELVHHAEGFSWQTYTLRAAWTDATSRRQRSQGFALRREPEDGVLAPYDIATQYAFHQQITDLPGVPVPALHWLELDPCVLGMPFYVMDRIDGVVPSPTTPQPFDRAHASDIGHQFVAILAAIHATDWQALQLPSTLAPRSDDPTIAATRQVDHWERFYTSSILWEIPLLRAALEWLREHVATSGRLVLCHGDFRNGNFLLRDNTIVGILDWELAHVSDPLEDLAWAALPAFGGRSGLVGHMLDRDRFLAEYAARSGIEITPPAFRFWTVLSHVKIVAIFLRGAGAFEAGRTNDVRLPMLAQRTVPLLKALAAELDQEP